MNDNAPLRLWRVDTDDGDHYIAVAANAEEAMEELADSLDGYGNGPDDPGHGEPYALRDDAPFTLSFVDGWDQADEPDEYRAEGFTVDEDKMEVTGTSGQWAAWMGRPCLLSCPAF